MSRDSVLVYLYTGSADVEGDLALWRDAVGGEVVWDVTAQSGTRVAAVRMGEGPLVLLADHRPPGSVIQIWEVPDLEAAKRELGDEWVRSGRQVEVPDGPILILADPSGNEVGLLESVRGRPMGERHSG
jgi:hypothetical protein